MLLQSLTILLAIVLVILIIRAAKLTSEFSSGHSKLAIKVTVFLGLWLAYLAILSSSEVLQEFSLPPRMPFLVVLPLFLLMAFVLTTETAKTVVLTLTASYLIYVQSFRIIVELIIWGGYQEGFIPIQATFEGFNFDVVVGLTAVPVAHYARRVNASKKVIIAWNIAGLIILGNTVRVFITTAYFPEIFGHLEPMVGMQFVQMPFLLVAGFFMPLAVFVHALSIKQQLVES
jgi:hypothetical protein